LRTIQPNAAALVVEKSGRWGGQRIVAVDGLGALASLESFGPDVILTDLNGGDLCRGRIWNPYLENDSGDWD
jgi:hypothetical protein